MADTSSSSITMPLVTISGFSFRTINPLFHTNLVMPLHFESDQKKLNGTVSTHDNSPPTADASSSLLPVDVASRAWSWTAIVLPSNYSKLNHDAFSIEFIQLYYIWALTTLTAVAAVSTARLAASFSRDNRSCSSYARRKTTAYFC